MDGLELFTAASAALLDAEEKGAAYEAVAKDRQDALDALDAQKAALAADWDTKVAYAHEAHTSAVSKLRELQARLTKLIGLQTDSRVRMG